MSLAWNSSIHIYFLSQGMVTGGRKKGAYTIGGGGAPIRFWPIYLPPGEEGFLASEMATLPHLDAMNAFNGRQLWVLVWFLPPPNLRRKHSCLYIRQFLFPPPPPLFILYRSRIHICSENMLPASTISVLSASFNAGFRSSLLDNGC